MRGCGRIIKNCILPDDNRERGYLLDANPIDPNGFEFNPFTKDLISDERISCADGYDISAPVTLTAGGEIIDGGPSITCNADEDNIVFNGCKRECSIPDGGLPTGGYIIESEPGVNVTYNPGHRVFDDHFSTLNVTCADDYYTDREGARITCPDDSDEFLPRGCNKNQCTIPEGYEITKNNEQEPVYNYEIGELNYDTFTGEDVSVSVSCASGFTMDPNANDGQGASIGECPGNGGYFSVSGCLRNIENCNLSGDVIPSGYLINRRPIESDDLKFNPITGDLITDETISCAAGYGDRSTILSQTEISITCNADEDNIVFSGCNKRQCSFRDSEVPEGYVANVLGSHPDAPPFNALQPGTGIGSAQLDYDFSHRDLTSFLLIVPMVMNKVAPLDQV